MDMCDKVIPLELLVAVEYNKVQAGVLKKIDKLCSEN